MKNIYTLLFIGLLSFSSLINAQQNPNFTLHTNGVTCLCPNAAVGETGDVNGVTYTKRTRVQITPQNAATTCTSGITDMSGLFQNNQSFNGNISTWDTSSVTNMSSMFYYTTSFNQPIGSWNVSNVTNMGSLFEGAAVFNQPIGSWNVSNVTNMDSLFESTSFNQSIGSWNVSNVTNMQYMFFGSTFNQPIGNWDVSNVVNMTLMFRGASNFNSDISNWNVSSVTNMSGMFQNSSFNKPIDNWNVSNVTNMSSMFEWSNFNQLLNNWNVSNVSNMSSMFGYSPFNQPINNWNVSNVTNMSNMFQNTTFNRPIGNWNVSNVTNMKWMFDTNTTFNQPLNSWNVSNVTNMERMFFNTQAFNQPLTNWNVGNVTNMGGMFRQSAFNQNLSSWQFSSNVILTIFNYSFAEYSQMNIQNYDALLSRFDTLGLLNNTLRSNDLLYSNQTARNNLINNKGWTIIGDTYSAAPVPPTLTTSYVAPRKVKIDFTPSTSNNVTGYKVYKSTDNITFTSASTITTNSYTETGLQNGTTYYYRISAVNNLNQESTTFLEVSATPSNTWYVATTGTITGFGSANSPMNAIQTAINASVSGEIVQVGNGTYTENIMYNGKNITVTSLFSTSQNEADITNTIIDGDANGLPVVRFHNNETNAAKLIGFTVQNGLTATNEWAAGIDTNTASPELKNVIIKNNNCGNSWPKTAGIRVVNANAPVLIENTTIKENTGGAIYSLTGATASLKIKNCKIYNNTTTTAASAIYIHGDQDSNLPIENTLIYNNVSNSGGNVIQGKDLVLLNCTIVNNNVADQTTPKLALTGQSGIFNSIIGTNHIITNQGNLKISKSLIKDGQSSILGNISPIWLTYTNNISSNPMFVNEAQHNYKLSDYSPAIGFGAAVNTISTFNYSAPITDIEGNIRPNPAGSNPDLGVYENSFATTQHNTTIYVATNGNNTGSVGLETAPFATIQAAINYAITGDQILVKPGTYTETLSLNKAIAIRSTNGYQQTILKALNQQTILTIFNSDAWNPILTSIKGFKFTTDTPDLPQTAMSLQMGAFSSIEKCWFEIGGGIATYYGYYDAINCVFNNTGQVSFHDAGYSTDDKLSRFFNCTIINANAINNAAPSQFPKIYNSIIVRNNSNTAPYFNGTVPLLSKVLIDANPNTQPGSVFTTISSIDDIYFNNVVNNDYTLKNYSPAIGYGGALSNVIDDIDNNPRPTLSFPDLGAYENSLDTRSNAPPRINQVANVTIDEDAAQQTINLSGIADGDLFATQTVTVSHTNSNAALFSNFAINHSASATTGTLVFTPTPNAFGTANITITVLDNGTTTNGGINSKTISFTITINPINDAPVALDDSILVNEGATITTVTNNATTLTNNDTDVDNVSLTTTIVTQPTNGSVTLNTNGTFSYTHNGSETTTDSFTYKAYDGVLNSNIATVSITVTPVNDAPLGNNDSISVNEGATVTLLSNSQTSVLNNDTDAENNTLTASVVTAPTNGTLTLNSNGTFSYTHNGTETITDSFTYKVNDGLLDSNITTVNITVVPVNDNGPTDILVSNFSLNENISSSTIGQFSVIDLDLPTDTHTYQLVSGLGDTNNSSFTINGTNLLNTVAFDFETNQTLSIRVKVTDANAVSHEKVFTINIVNVNDISITHTKTDSYCAGSAGNGTITINTVNQIMGTPTYSWTATNGGVIPTAQVNNQNLTNLPSGTYTVSITDSFFTYTQSFTIALIPQYADLSICYVSSDETQVTKNRIYLNNQGNYNTAFYEILKESSVSNVYTSIGTILPNQNSFLDDMSNNMSQEYRYKVRLLDNCGNTSSSSTLHKTILLQSNTSVNNSVNLNWTPYIGTTIPSYIIYRKINQGVFQQIATISSSSTTYNDPTANVAQNSYEYYVAVGVSSCNTSTGRNTNTITEIKSNRAILGTNLAVNNFSIDNQIMLFPNPTTNLLNIKLNDGNELISGEVYNSLGQKVLTITTTQFSVEQLPSASYLIKVVTAQGQGTKMFIKN
ncbi:BspA family leucine-rich repeat surface protein [Flavobacterium sp.]|uniref:BspA family leucine-rich repeat surface protein n=1 Tax=Flavobacterium sp. TaxID=239 RepID=UPI0033424B85